MNYKDTRLAFGLPNAHYGLLYKNAIFAKTLNYGLFRYYFGVANSLGTV